MTKNAVLPVVCLVLAFAGLAGCGASTTGISTALPTNLSRSTDGFEFQVNVSNVHPRLGETVVITTELKNISNTAVTIQELGGQTMVQISNAAGEVVWGQADNRSGTTLTITAGIGWSFNFTSTWKVGNNAGFTVPVTAGTYTLSVSDTGFYDPSLNMQVPFSVTPIQITVSD